MPINFTRALTEVIAPPWLRGFFSQRWLGLHGLVADKCMQAMTLASKAGWLRSVDHPADTLPLTGSERSMPRYAADTDTTYRNRLHGAWKAWSLNSYGRVMQQLGDFGLTDVVILPAENADPRPERPAWRFEEPPDVSNPSRFVVIIGEGNYSEEPACGDGTVCGDGSTCGSSATEYDVEAIRGIIRKFRYHAEINPQVLVVLHGAYCAQPGLTCGDGTVCGGDTVHWDNEVY